jgi:O-antigen/teichoic acid export membrane protein
VPVLLLPIFTRILSPEEFGQIGILTTVAAVIGVLVSFGLETTIFRGYGQAERNSEEAQRFLNTVGGFALLAPTVLALAFCFIGAPALAGPLGISVDALRLASLGAAWTASATVVPLAILRSQERLSQYLSVTGVQLVATVALTFLLVAGLELAVTGWMLAYALSSFALLVSGLVILNFPWSLTFELGALRTALMFGVPLIPHALSHWGLSVSDRAILGAFVPTQEVGTYYVAYLLCLPVSLAAVATGQATQPIFAEADASNIRQREIRRIVASQAVLIVLIATAVALVGPPLIAQLLPGDYAHAATLVPWLALGTALYGLYVMPINAIILVAGRTHHLWLISAAAAAANISLNLVLVPSIGTLAAAFNTTIGYGVLLTGVLLYMRRACDPPVPYDAGRIGVGVLVIGLPSIAAAALTDHESLVGLAVRVTVILGTAAMLLAGPFRAEVTAAIRAMRRSGAGREE